MRVAQAFPSFAEMLHGPFPSGRTDLRHAGFWRLPYERPLLALPMPWMLRDTPLVLVDCLTDKRLHLAANGVLAQYTSCGEVVEVRMPPHLLKRGKLRFT